MKNKKNGSAGAELFRTALAVLIIVLLSVIALNIVLIRKTESERISAEGQMRLSSIAGRVENSLYQSECLLDSVAMKIEQMISSDKDADRLLTEYFCAETVADIGEKSDGSCFSAYAAYDGKLYINGFVPDDDFVLEERTWLVEAKKRMGAVNVTDPYIDASTGQMCYTISKLLPDGKTVVGLDFRLSEIQKYIEEMDSSGTGTSIIVNGKGMIIGHSQPECVGKYCSEFEDYSELVNKVYMLYGDSFDYHTDNGKYTIFSERTNYDWYLIVSVRRGMENSGISGFYYYIIIVMLIFSVAMVVFFVYSYRRKAAAESALLLKEEHIRGISSELKRPLSQILSKSEMIDSGEGSAVRNDIGESAKELERMLDELASVSDANAKTETKTVVKVKKERTVSHKKRIMLITAVLVITSAFAIVLNTDTQVKW